MSMYTGDDLVNLNWNLMKYQHSSVLSARATTSANKAETTVRSEPQWMGNKLDNHTQKIKYHYLSQPNFQNVVSLKHARVTELSIHILVLKVNTWAELSGDS